MCRPATFSGHAFSPLAWFPFAVGVLVASGSPPPPTSRLFLSKQPFFDQLSLEIVRGKYRALPPLTAASIVPFRP